MEQGAIMMDQQKHHRMEETRHMGVEVKLMEEVVATQVVLQVMKLEIIQLVDTANLFLMQGQGMVHLPALPTVDTLNQTRTSPTVNQLQLQRHMEGVIVVEQDTTQHLAMMTGDIQHLQVLMKHQVMVEVMGSQSMVSIMLNLFLSKVKVSLYKPLYLIVEREMYE